MWGERFRRKEQVNLTFGQKRAVAYIERAKDYNEKHKLSQALQLEHNDTVLFRFLLAEKWCNTVLYNLKEFERRNFEDTHHSSVNIERYFHQLIGKSIDNSTESFNETLEILIGVKNKVLEAAYLPTELGRHRSWTIQRALNDIYAQTVIEDPKTRQPNHAFTPELVAEWGDKWRDQIHENPFEEST